MKNGDTNNAMKACCADLMDYVRKVAKFSRLPVPIQVTTLEDVNEEPFLVSLGNRFPDGKP